MKKISILVIIVLMIFTSCESSHVEDDVQSFVLNYNKKRGNPLEYEITVRWNKLTPGRIDFKFEPGISPNPIGNWWLLNLDNSNKDKGQYTTSFTFPDNNPSPTNYHIWAEFDPIAAGDNIQSNHKSEIISFKKFRIIQLHMVNDNLWPYYSSGTTIYNGGQKLNEAFRDAGVLIKVTSNKTGLSNTTGPDGLPIDFSSTEKLFRWAVMTEYGPSMTGVDPKVTILSGIDDIPTSLLPNPTGQVTTGWTVSDPGHTTPQISFVLYSRIRNAYASSVYDQVRVISGTGIHELGHAFGITGDDPNILPPHGENNQADCTMKIGHYPSNYNNCVFCDSHKVYFTNQNWFLEGQ